MRLSADVVVSLTVTARSLQSQAERTVQASILVAAIAQECFALLHSCSLGLEVLAEA